MSSGAFHNLASVWRRSTRTPPTAGCWATREATAIGPAVEEAKRLGLRVTGPVPADTLFNQAIDGTYDVVLAMYHDQGHIPIKVHGFERSISINLGLPLIRTSVDHGTAFDIAGKGVAQDESMAEAIKAAAALAFGHGVTKIAVQGPSLQSIRCYNGRSAQ